MKQPRIMVYPPDMDINKIIANNGIVLDNICISCSTTEELSKTGNYTLDAEFINDKDIANKIDGQCILKVLTDYGYEIFQIRKPKRSLKYVTVYAEQFTIPQMKSLWLDDVRPTQESGAAALTHMLSNAIGTKNINLISDIETTNTAYYDSMTLYKACFDCDNSFVERWGGGNLETQRRGKNVTLSNLVGGEKSFSIKERKNLKGFTDTRDLDNYITRGIGIGFDGIKGHYIDSPLINNYKDIHTSTFKYEHIKVKTKDMSVNDDDVVFDTLEEAQAELDRLVSLEFSKNNVDKITATYDIDYVKLEDTEEYKNYSHTEKAEIGDYVKVDIPSLKYSLVVRVVKKEYDALKQRTKNIKLSNNPISGTLSSNKIIKNLQEQFKKSNLQNIQDYITSMINAGLQNSNAILRPNEFLMMDQSSINKAKNVWRWNAGALVHSNNGYYSKDWNVGMTADGQINANMMTTGVLSAILIQSLDKKTYIDLASGKFQLGAGNGQTVATHTNSGSTWRHSDGSYSEANARGFYKDGRPYHSLMTAGYCVTGGSAGAVPKTATIQLGDEWKGKPFTVLASTVDTQGGIAMEYVKRIQLNVTNIDTVNARFNITGSWTSVYNGQENDKELKSMYIVIGG